MGLPSPPTHAVFEFYKGELHRDPLSVIFIFPTHRDIIMDWR